MIQVQALIRRPRVLILSASSGVGHVRAAQALEQVFRAIVEDALGLLN